MKTPTATAVKPATRALTLAASARVAPIRFAIRVDAAMEMGKGILGDDCLVSICLLHMGCGALELISKGSPKAYQVLSK